MSGPHDSPARCRQVIATLTNSVGLENFHYLIPIPGSALADYAEDEVVDDLPKELAE